MKVAGGKAKAVGKLAHLGAAYLQHRRFISTLRSAPSHDLRGRLTSYLTGLSAASRGGFQVTLGTMIGSDRTSDGKAFLQQLSVEVKEVIQTLNEAPSESLRTGRAARFTQRRSYEDDLELVSAWFDLSPVARRQAVLEHVQGLSVEDHCAFIEHAQEMHQNVVTNVARHEAGEEQAWGGYIEDRINLLNAQIATGRRDQRWVERMQELQGSAQFLEDVTRSAQMAMNARTASAGVPEAGPQGTLAAEGIEVMIDEFASTGVAPEGLIEALGQISDPAVMERVQAKLQELGVDAMGSDATIQISDYYVDGPGSYSLWWPLTGPGQSVEVPFDELPRDVQFHVLWAEFTYRLTRGSGLREAGKLDEAQAVFQECLERAAQLDVGLLRRQAYEGLMTVAERRGDRAAAKRYLELATREQQRPTTR